MDKFGPITNTHTVEDAVREAMVRLDASPQTARVIELTNEARRYQELVASWELLPPVPEEQFETIGEIMRLLGSCVTACDESREQSESTGGQDKPGGELELDREDDSAFELDESGPRTPPTPGMPVGRIQFGREQNQALEELLQLETEPTPEVVRPQTRPWQTTPSNPGVELKVVHVQDDGLRRHLLARLQHGVTLQPHSPTQTELIQIVDGSLQVAGQAVHGGSFVRFPAGQRAPALTAEGETVLFLIGSERTFSGD